MISLLKFLIDFFFEGILNGPDIRKLIASDEFDSHLTEQEAITWDCMKAVIENFLGKHRSEHYELFVDNMLEAMSIMGGHVIEDSFHAFASGHGEAIQRQTIGPHARRLLLDYN